MIAADLTEMQVNANIDEADVGRIRPGQHVTFRVDAYPTDNFVGTVTQIRLQPVVVQNVTTYGTVITVPNRELKLKPGMTANVKIEIAKRTNALRIPNAALRFRPTRRSLRGAQSDAAAGDDAFAGGGRGGRGGAAVGGGGADSAGSGGRRQRPARQQRPRRRERRQRPRPRAAGSRCRRTPARTATARAGGGRGAAVAAAVAAAAAAAEVLSFRRACSSASRRCRPRSRQQFIARMKERGGDTSAFEAATHAGARRAKRRRSAAQAQTIDALFAPLPVVESRGRAWLFIDKQLKPVTLRLGISDGTYTELLSDELQENTEVVDRRHRTGVDARHADAGRQRQSADARPRRPGRPGGGGRGGRG